MRCKDCRREYMRLRGDLHRRQTKQALDNRRAIARKYLIEILRAGRCADCGLADAAVLEFDHVGPKQMEVGRLVREGYRLKHIKAEIANCELVCANCHRRRTATRCRSWRIDAAWRSS
ncbi:MAG: HNH endonuclease, partial [Thermoleophilaceae bacterium]